MTSPDPKAAGVPDDGRRALLALGRYVDRLIADSEEQYQSWLRANAPDADRAARLSAVPAPVGKERLALLKKLQGLTPEERRYTMFDGRETHIIIESLLDCAIYEERANNAAPAPSPAVALAVKPTQPLIWVSSKQLPNLAEIVMQGYLPFELERRGNFDTPLYASPLTVAGETPADALTVRDYEEAMASHLSHVRDLDVAMNGDGAATRPLLIDIKQQLLDIIARDAALSASEPSRSTDRGST